MSDRKYPQRKRTKRIDPYDPDNVMTNPEGPLATIDLKRILTKPEAFDLLQEEDREELLSMLQPEHIETNAQGKRRIKQSFLQSSEFKHNVSLFQDDVREGRTDPEWIRQAYVASEKRRDGMFDAYLSKEAKKDWDIDFEALSPENECGESSKSSEPRCLAHEEGDRMIIDDEREPEFISMRQIPTREDGKGSVPETSPLSSLPLPTSNSPLREAS